MGFSLAAGVASLALIPYSSTETALSIPVGRYFGKLTFTADALAVSLAEVACVIGSLAVTFSVDHMRGEVLGGACLIQIPFPGFTRRR